MDDKTVSDPAIHRVEVHRVDHDQLISSEDLVTVEAPLQVVLRYGSRENRQLFRLALTMRAPGQDEYLALGYLFTENIIHKPADVVQIRHLEENEIIVELREGLTPDLGNQTRNTYVNASCGICGKSGIEDIRSTIPYLLRSKEPVFHTTEIRQWPSMLSKTQKLFPLTGGIHAAALLSGGKVLASMEDIGRHNAVDKLIGYALKHFSLPLQDAALVVSSRASFELVQKALMAGLPLLAAIGATSSLAIELASEHNMTLIGFLKDTRFNIYTGIERIRMD
jgi:FdhD protein